MITTWWVLRIIWELEPGPLGFLELRRRMDNCSSSMLAERLSQLATAGVIEKHVDKFYEITTAGRALGAALEPLWEWARRWPTSLPSKRTNSGAERSRQD